MAKRASSRLVRNRNLNNEIEDKIEKIVDDEAKNPVDPPAGSRKRKKGSTRDEPEPETQLDEPAQSLPTASKDRLLRLLDKHIQKKKPRRSCAGPPKSTIQNIPIPIISIQTEVQDQLDVQENQVDYSIFAVEDLVKMVSEVGVDTRGMDKLDLIRNCEKFRDLIITPQNPRIDHVEKDISNSVASTGTRENQSNTIKTSTSAFPSPAHEKPSNIQSNRTIRSSKPESSRKKKKQAGPENSATEQPQSNTLETSTPAVPSSANETSSNIESSRTMRSSKPESSRKTKKQAGPENSVTEQPQSNTLKTSTPAVPSSENETSSNIESSRTMRSSKPESSRKTKKQAGPENSATEQPQSNTLKTSTPAVPSSAQETSSTIQSSRTIRFSEAESSSKKKKGKERA
ncbi:uncharacterized protein MELLADRAFT_84182 [Melampsora larici-populina 98AG31]|uniref:Uncharacterized protein n=1 Tax=Melampsora larici-populina (strain 98AG31 / pathotype 3-4-7) TaxID=747676 RepID=F4SBU3_MELLP|nr:uncharacterized protein MELLADRAFT_84182 [Melampsora larici-populina 98AG31]EGF97893.1 hypothetical protein MELLADRAFT_84182 [Melampsora larici-populina 98AG31]